MGLGRNSSVPGLTGRSSALGQDPARYSEDMTMRSLRSVAVATLMVLVAATGFADDPEKKNLPKREAGEMGEQVEDRFNGLADSVSLLTRQRVLSESAAAAQGFYGSSGTRMELFARAGFSLLNVSAEDSISVSGGPAAGGDSISASRLMTEFGWGAGARLMQGSWGIEGSYNIIESLSLSPSWLVMDAAGAPRDEPGLTGLLAAVSRADLFVGQGIRTFQLAGGTAEVFVGIGAGWMRVTDSSTDRLLSGEPLQGLEQIPPEIPPSFIPEVVFEADRTSVVYAGSLGVAFRIGRILLRPRADLIISRALTTELTVGFPDLGELTPEDVGSFGISYGTSVNPTIFLLSLDIGLGN